MKRLKKYFKLPPKNVCIIYGVAIAVILIAFLSVYFTFGKQLTAFVSDTQHFNAWLAQYKSLSAVIFILIRAFQTVIKIIPAEPLEIASGYAFGTWGGLFYCSVGTFLLFGRNFFRLTRDCVSFKDFRSGVYRRFCK